MFFLLFFLLRRKGSFQCRKPVCAALNAGGGGGKQKALESGGFGCFSEG